MFRKFYARRNQPEYCRVRMRQRSRKDIDSRANIEVQYKYNGRERKTYGAVYNRGSREDKRDLQVMVL